MTTGIFDTQNGIYFQKNDRQILTKDTDSGRINSDMSMAITPDGRKILFYSKTFKSGRLSNSRVLYTLPFSVSVEVGSGEINGAAVSWSASNLTVPNNSFTLIYVDHTGAVSQTTDFPMSLIKNVIVLAYVNVGNSEIVYLEETEKTGRSIYCRRQVQSLGVWVWDDYEFVLNVGGQPRAFYDPSTGNIYMAYKKDGIAYCRIFDLTSETTWAYIPNTLIGAGNIIGFSRNPESSSYFKGGSSNRNDAIVSNVDLFPLSATSVLCFIYVDGAFRPYIILPNITGSFLGNIYYPYYLEIYTFDGESYTLESTIPFYGNTIYFDERMYRCPTDNQDRYIGAKVYSNLMIEAYTTLPENRTKINVFPAFYEYTLVSGNINIEAVEGRVSFSCASQKSDVVKTYEYDESRDFEYDTVLFAVASQKSDVVKTYEYEETRDFESDTAIFSTASSTSSVTITTI